MFSWDKFWDIADKGATLGFYLVPAVMYLYGLKKI